MIQRSPHAMPGIWGHVLTLGEQLALAVNVADTFSEVGQDMYDQRGSANRLRLQDAHR